MKVKVLMVFALAAALIAVGCGKSDGDLQKAAEAKLAADNVKGVTVVVKDGVATLSGEVADITVKTKAEASAKVEGIKSVESSQLKTKPLPTPEVSSPDKMIYGVVTEGLKKKNITGVSVTVSNGEVTLSGIAPKDKWPEIMMVANEAKPAKVINRITEK